MQGMHDMTDMVTFEEDATYEQQNTGARSRGRSDSSKSTDRADKYDKESRGSTGSRRSPDRKRKCYKGRTRLSDQNSDRKKKSKKKRKDKEGKDERGRSRKKHKRKRKSKGSSSDSSQSSTTSPEPEAKEVSDDDQDFPLNNKRLGGVWLHPNVAGYAKLAYPDKSKLKIIKAAPGSAPRELLQSLQFGSMTSETIDKIIFILTSKGPNTRLIRFSHIGSDKDRKRKDFREALIREAERLGKGYKLPDGTEKKMTTRLERVWELQQEGGHTYKHKQ
jgi:hypothetical protein